MSKLLFVAVLLTGVLANAQKEDFLKVYMNRIDSSDLRKHLTVLASDAYEGRETGKKGQQMAAEYIQQSFAEDGCSIAPGIASYQQSFQVIETLPGGDITVGKQALAFKTDFVYLGAKKKIQLGQIPLYVLEDFEKDPQEKAGLVHRLKGMDIRGELMELRNAVSKAKTVVLVTSNYEELYEYLEHYATTKSMRLAEEAVQPEIPIIVVRAAALKKVIPKSFAYLLGKGKQTSSKKPTVITTISGSLNKEEQLLTSSNVLGYIPGSDPVLSDEIVIITAHYDHIGIVDGVVYNGADDDGTGTAALLEIAEALMAARKEGHGPKRSVLVMAVSGEEKGLLGSSYYVNHPVIPLRKTISDLNIDMIGRNDIAHENSSEYIYIIGSNMLSSDLHNANEKANTTYTQLSLDYKFNRLDDPNQFYYRSDHYNFAKNDIPSIFYFSGVHEDYHQPTDDIEKINFTKVERVAKLVFSTAWLLADETERPRLD